MILLKGSAFTKQFGGPNDPPFQEWLRQFHDINPEHLLAAFNLWRKNGNDDFLDAVKLRRLALNYAGQSLPSEELAYEEACKHSQCPLDHQWTTPIVYFAGKNTGWFELRTETRERVFPSFREHYRALIARSRKGEVLELPKKHSIVEQIQHKPTPKLEALQYLSDLKQFLDE